MPIVFEQPGPYNPGAQYGYGMLEQYMKDREFALRMNQQRGGGGGGQSTGFGGWGTGGGGGGGGLNGAGGYQGSGIATNPDEPLNQAEVIRMQRLQQGLSAVDEQVNNGTLTPEEANDFKVQIQTGLSPLRARAQRMQLQAQQAQVNQVMQQQAMQTTMMGEDRAAAAQMLERQIVPITNPNTGETEHMYVDHQGNPHPVFGQSQGGTQRDRQAEADQKEDDRYLSHYEKVSAAVDKVQSDQYGEMEATPTMAARRRTRQEEIAARLGEIGLAPSINDFRESRERRRIDKEVREQAQRQSGRTGASPDENEIWLRTQAEQRRRGISGAAPSPQPIPADRSPDTLPLGQRTVLGRLMEIRQRLTADGYSGESFNRAIALYRHYGNTRAMPPAQRDFFERIVGSLDRQYGPQTEPAPPAGRRSVNLGPASQVLVDNPGS